MPTGTRPKGRPSKITDVAWHTDDGTPVTVADRIPQLIAQGNYMETAAAAAGIGKTAVYDWLRIAATAHGKVHRGERLTAHERRCIDFANAVAEAEADAEAKDLERLATLADGKDAAVAARVTMWRLERRFAKRWGQRGSLEITGADGGAVELDLGESAREALGDVLGVMAERLAKVQLVNPAQAAEDDGTPLLEATEERPGADDHDVPLPQPAEPTVDLVVSDRPASQDRVERRRRRTEGG